MSAVFPQTINSNVVKNITALDTTNDITLLTGNSAGTKLLSFCIYNDSTTDDYDILFRISDGVSIGTMCRATVPMSGELNLLDPAVFKSVLPDGSFIVGNDTVVIITMATPIQASDVISVSVLTIDY